MCSALRPPIQCEAGTEGAHHGWDDRRVPLIRFLELLEICADLLADPQFGLKFGAQYEPRHAGVVGNVVLASRTVGEAFETMGRYLPTMVDATVHGVEVSDGIVFVYSYYIDPLMMSYRQKADWAIAFACNLVRVGLGDPRWTPHEVLLPQLPTVAESLPGFEITQWWGLVMPAKTPAAARSTSQPRPRIRRPAYLPAHFPGFRTHRSVFAIVL